MEKTTKRTTLHASLLLFFVHSSCVWAQDCGQARQDATRPIPSSKDVGWFLDEEQLGPPLQEFVSDYEAIRIFKELARNREIPFKYPDDGCFARAHAMSQLMEKRGILSGKVFLEGDLQVTNPYVTSGKTEWRYHVAPTLIVKKGDLYVKRVIDPSIFDKPVPVEEWVAIQIRHKPNQKLKKTFRERFAYQSKTRSKGEESVIGEKSGWSPEDLKEAEQVLKLDLYLQHERTGEN